VKIARNHPVFTAIELAAAVVYCAVAAAVGFSAAALIGGASALLVLFVVVGGQLVAPVGGRQHKRPHASAGA
jgi:hypothetical protein